MTVRELAVTFSQVKHVWDGLGVHLWEPGVPQDCAVCEMLDTILEDDQHEVEQEALHQFWASGLVFLANLAVLHPRGYALTVAVDDAGQAARLFVQGDGKEPWVFAQGPVEHQVLDRYLAAEQARIGEDA